MSSKIEKLFQSLDNLKNLDYGNPELALRSHAKIEALLNVIFDIGRKKINFTTEQRKKLGPLLVNAIKPIQVNIERVGCQYRTTLDSSVLRKRSAIEFLIKDYGDLPVGEENKLSEKLGSANIQETITILDEIISKWHDVSDSDEPKSQHRFDDIPASHTWWCS